MAVEVSQWSDDDLFRALRDLGLSPGPVTATTRPVYIRKVKTLLQSQDFSSPENRRSKLGRTDVKGNLDALDGHQFHSTSILEVLADSPASDDDSTHSTAAPSHSEPSGLYSHNIPPSITDTAKTSAPPLSTCSDTGSTTQGEVVTHKISSQVGVLYNLICRGS